MELETSPVKVANNLEWGVKQALEALYSTAPFYT
jgi:hypothetical protein